MTGFEWLFSTFAQHEKMIEHKIIHYLSAEQSKV